MNFMPINVATLRADDSFTFDLLILINGKFILYIREGDGIDEQRLQRLIDQEVDRLYVPQEKVAAYRGYVEGMIQEAVESETMLLDEKAEIVDNAAVNAVDALEQTLDDPESEEAYTMTVNAAKGLRKVVNGNPGALKKIYHKKGRKVDLILQHCKNVSALAVRFAFLQGHRGEDLDNLGAAALLHDLGLNQLNKEEQLMLFKKDPKKFTPDEKRAYQLHPADLKEILEGRPYVNPEIIRIAIAHEEKLKGQGYPERKEKIGPLEEILSLCNSFEKRMSCLGMTCEEALKDFYATEVGNYRLEVMKKFKEALKKEGLLDSDL